MDSEVASWSAPGVQVKLNRDFPVQFQKHFLTLFGTLPKNPVNGPVGYFWTPEHYEKKYLTGHGRPIYVCWSVLYLFKGVFPLSIHFFFRKSVLRFMPENVWKFFVIHSWYRITSSLLTIWSKQLMFCVYMKLNCHTHQKDRHVWVFSC